MYIPAHLPISKYLLCLFLFLLSFAACSQRNDAIEQVETAIYAAKGYLGTPHGKNGLDCSKLTQISYKEAGINLGRSSRDQYLEGTRIKRENIRRGDLLFFKLDGKTIGHVGLVLSNKDEPVRFIHTSTSRGVIETPLSDSYWNTRYAGARRMVDWKD